MIKRIVTVLSWLVLTFSLGAVEDDVRVITLRPGAGMDRAELYYWSCGEIPRAVLLLAPGYNGNGRNLVENANWREYAKENKFDLVGLSFSSSENDHRSGRSYYYASKGSGKVFIAGLDEIYQGRTYPLFMYGFSGGAHFVSRFSEWAPDRVTGFVAYAAGWWDDPVVKRGSPFGIVACGSEDERLPSGKQYFNKGRKINKPWLWIKVPHTGHKMSFRLERFARKYFSAIAEYGDSTTVWVNIDTGEIADRGEEKRKPTGFGALPSADLVPDFIKMLK